MVSIIAIYVERRARRVCKKKVRSDSFENKIIDKSSLNMSKEMTDVKLNCYCYIEILETICVQKTNKHQANFKMLSTKSVYKSYMYKQNLALNNPQVLICHKTQ